MLAGFLHPRRYSNGRVFTPVVKCFVPCGMKRKIVFPLDQFCHWIGLEIKVCHCHPLLKNVEAAIIEEDVKNICSVPDYIQPVIIGAILSLSSLLSSHTVLKHEEAAMIEEIVYICVST